MKKIIKKSKKWVQLTVDPKIYPLTTVYSSGYVFLDRAHIYLDKDVKGRINIWLFPKDKKENLDALGMDFYNELLNYAHYFSSLKANSEALKSLIQRALFSATPSLVEEAENREVEDLVKQLEDEEKKKTSKKR